MRLRDILRENKDLGKLNKLAKRLGVSLGSLKKMTDAEIETVLKNVGHFDFTPNSKFDSKQLKRGIEVEKEHSSSNLVATLIAKDHLSEIPDYYSRLDDMERSARS